MQEALVDKIMSTYNCDRITASQLLEKLEKELYEIGEENGYEK